MATVYGIDLGTTYSCIAKCDDHQQVKHFCPPDGVPGGTILPSVVCFDEITGKPIVGLAAKNSLGRRGMPERTISFFKRYVGNDFLEQEIIVGRKKRKVSPIEGSACVLHNLLEAANEEEKAAGNSPSNKAVITIPAGFNAKQRMCVKIAAELAGIEVLGLVHEPTAAAISYGISSGETVLVFDLGGGTLDVSIVKNNKGKYEVLASAGDNDTIGTYIGGMDWDKLLADYAVEKAEGLSIYQKGHIEKLTKSEEEAILLQKAEECKIQLSRKAWSFSFPDLSSVEIKPSEFEKISSDLIERCMKVVKATIDKAEKKMGKLKIDRCVMAGGSSNMPMIKTNLSRFLAGRIANGRPEAEWLHLANPHRAIAEGAARYAYLLEHKLAADDGISVLEESRFSYGTSVYLRDRNGVDNPQPFIRNLIKSTDPMMFDYKNYPFKTSQGKKFINVDVYENSSDEDRFPLEKGKVALYSWPYRFDPEKKVTNNTKVLFNVSRDKDGIITIIVSCEGHPTRKYTTTPITDTVKEDIKHSIELMDILAVEECK